MAKHGRWGFPRSRTRLSRTPCARCCKQFMSKIFLHCSYGYRPGRSAHDAVRALHRVADRGGMNWVLEADIVSFFDSVDRTALREMLQERVADGALLRLVS